MNLINLNLRVKLCIVSTDFTTVYYDLSVGLDSPFDIEHLKKFDQKESVDKF